MYIIYYIVCVLLIVHIYDILYMYIIYYIYIYIYASYIIYICILYILYRLWFDEAKSTLRWEE